MMKGSDKMGRFDGKVVLVTGGNRNTGLDLVEKFAREGAKVFMCHVRRAGRGMITCDCFGPNVYHNGAPNDRYTVQYTYFDEWVGLIDEFVDCIRNHKTPLINLKWHKETIQAMLGCYESIQSGKIAKVGGK